MRNTILTLSLLFIAFLQLPAQGIEFFHGSWEEALVKAQQEDKPIFVDAYASWCGPCKRMAAQVFPEAAVGEVFNANFISLKLDMEKPEAASFRANHPVRAYPTLFFLDAEGNTVHTVVGGQQVKGLINQAREALGKVDDLPRYVKKYEAGDRDPAFMTRYVRALVRQGEPHLRIANEYVRDQKGKLSEPDNLRFLLVAATDADSRIFDKLIEHKAAVTKLISQDAFDKQVALAFNKTKATAIELEAPKLLSDAAKKYKSIDPDAAATYQLEGEFQLAALGNEAKAYQKAAKKYFKSIPAKEGKMLTDLFQQLSGSRFVANDAKVEDLTAEVGLAAAEATDGYREYYLYAQWLNEVGRKKEAMDAAEKSKTLIPEEQPNTHRLVDFLIKKIQEA
ncbi:hypothetical protein CEQ90_01715 [Lewinellaceae bacterium SD302]|nr:hypothetical protein CEQ90_01715 [Lewinellaceae bacterium SD302]